MAAAPQATKAWNLGLIVLLGGLWGMPYALNKVALASIPLLTLVAARVVIAAAALWIVVGLCRCQRPAWRSVMPVMAVQGCLACLIPYALIAIGQQTVDSALTAILNSTAPLFVCLIGGAWPGREPWTAERWLGTAIGLSGVVLIAGLGALAGLGRSLAGQGAIIVATAASAVGVLYGRRLDHVAPEIAAAGTLSAAALLLVPLCLWLEAPLHTTPSSAALVALAANALAATALGFVVYFRLMRTIGSLRTASVGYLKPVVGVLIGYTVFAEPLTFDMAFGLVTILIGLLVIHQSDRRRIALGFWALPRRLATWASRPSATSPS